MLKKLMMLVVVLGVSMTAHAGDKPNTPYTTIDAETLQEMRTGATPPIVVDSRGGKYFDNVIIEGAIHLPANETTTESLSALSEDKNTPIVFYCANTSCPASELAAYKAADAGYTTLYKYPGGIDEWKEKGLPISTTN